MYARIIDSPDMILVRFEQVQPRSFDDLRDRFYQEVPSAQWNWQIRWMVVSSIARVEVLNFCYREFGPNNVRIQHKNWVGT